MFRLSQPGKEVHYLLSKDIFRSRVPEELKESVTFVAPRQFYEVGAVRAATLRSTDQGVAFLVECEGKLFYHAGDLNCWVWGRRAPLSERPDEAGVPRGALPPGGEAHRRGLCAPGPPAGGGLRPGDEVFLRDRRADHVFPMHMWGDYSVVPLFKSTPTYREYADRVMDVKGPGQVFEL